MEKKLPRVFANKIEKPLANNETVHYASKNDQETQLNKDDRLESIHIYPKDSVMQKINRIFQSSNYIYKAEVKIKLKQETITKKIIGKNRDHLITMENELIPISEIIDIEQL